MEESPSPKPEFESTTTTLTCRDSELSNNNSCSNSSFCSSEVMLPKKNTNNNNNNDRGEVVNGYIVYSRRKTKNLHEEDEEQEKKVSSEGRNGIVKVEEESSEVVVIQNDVVLGRLKRNRKPTWKTVVDECEVGEEEKAVVFKTKSSEKVVVVNRRPVTVKELFDTGLLDGVPVFYMGCKKDSTSGLRGIIQDGGILCSCCICNGRRIIPPSQFEIHACNTYKRAAQYICLENGKSLLDLLRACRAVPLHALEVAVQNFLCSPPEEKYFTCKSCRGCFPSSSVERVGLLCQSCVEERKSEKNSIKRVDKRVRSPKPVLFPSPSSTSELCNSSQTKRRWKKREKSSKRDASSAFSKGASDPILFHKSLWKRKTKSYKLTVKLNTAPVTSTSMFPVTSTSTCLSSENKSQWKIAKKYQRLHKLIFEENGLPDGAKVAYYARGQKLLVGIKRGSGIVCGCCNTLVSPSQFEVHAGWASRRKPYAYIYTSDGMSLHELAMFILKERKYTAKYNDDLCVVCWDGGNLLLCDGCPRSFHKECASVSSVPRGNWYCQICQNMFQRESFVADNVHAVAAERVEGVGPIEQIARCIRIVKDTDAEMGGCVLCGGSDFSRSGFGPRTIIFCDQCEKEYHVGCLRDHKMAFLKELPEGMWICCDDCTRIHSILENILVRGAERLPESLLDVIKVKQEEILLGLPNEIDVRWRLLNGKIASSETRPFLLQAVSMFHECFDAIIDPVSGSDLIPAMVYGRSVQTQDFGGFYCALLMVNSCVVSAAMLRVFGRDVAELPLVATCYKNRGKGYFQTLFSCIERLLAFLNVKNFVLPAAEEAISIWTDKFGFSLMKPEQLSNYRKTFGQMMAFKGTIMLEKPVPSCRIVNTRS
ncbi:increased DNA methylation 1-like [Arachis stenosperma]|uniref:increased DNA methylation 1-like n=1 Tax=Arachis stenosperma TaxID=217475 RepID=UPI0025ACCC1A|nr:increased DNA methylation 1-like [Arachis stenosperma]